MNLALDLILRSTALLATGLAISWVCRGASAAVRHRVLTVTVVAALLLPLASLVAPRWTLPWLPASAATAPVLATAPQAAPAVSTETAFTLDTSAPSPARRISPDRLVGAIWLTGSLLVIFPLLLGLVRLRRISRDSAATAGAWSHDARRIAVSMGLARDVRTLSGTRADLLVAWGWRRPTILVPHTAVAWSAERRQVVLAHELAHLVRGDWAAQLGADVVRALYWFNPLAWALDRQLRVESECACDDHVLRQGVSATDYASHLVGIAHELNVHRRQSLPAPAMARPTSLEGRVRAMLTTSRDRRPVTRLATTAIALAFTLFTLAAAGAQPALVPVSGTVVDPTGRVLPNVLVALSDPATASRFEVRTSQSGQYQFASVLPADYILELTLLGFQPATARLHVAAATTHNHAMQVGTLQETIRVTGPSASAPAADVAAQRASAGERFAAHAVRGTEPCRASGPPPVGGNILPPWKLVHVTATYPEDLRASGVGGTVTLTAVIGVDGAVRDIADVKGPHAALEAAAVDAVRDWQFSATYLNCEPIEVRMTVTTNFVP